MKTNGVNQLILVILLAFCALFMAEAQPIPVKKDHTVIIDTDCAIDDMRAITLLLSRPEITVKAIVTSDGSVSPQEGALKVLSLLDEFSRHDIAVAAGNELKSAVAPPWREFNRQLPWGRNAAKNALLTGATECLEKALENQDEKVILLCLGPLTNVEQLISKDRSLLNKIERMVWYNESVKPLRGFNYEFDKDAAEKVLSSGIRIDVISNLSKEKAFFDSGLADVTEKADTRQAGILNEVHSRHEVIGMLKANHFRLCDDLTVLWLTNPELFNVTPLLGNIKIRYITDYNEIAVKEAMSDMIKGSYVSENNVVFRRFPDQRELFDYDVRLIMDSAIARYGYDEWKANVMTDEFHGHLGVFSIVGAKMGIRAREYFRVQPDMLKVVTFAGSRPPYSCLNDGIQVSTGATLGMGTIALASDTVTSPSAIFTFRDKSIRITLKKEYLEQVDADINEGIVKFGLADDGYWKLIRRNALKYWLEWDRNEIFDIDVIR